MNRIKILFAFSAISLVGMTGCKKFVDVNQDPNNNVSTRSDYVMTGAEGTTYRNQVSATVHIVPGTWTGVYAHSTSYTGGGNEKTYDFTTADFDAFTTLYDNLIDYEYVKNNAVKDGMSYLKDPANVMECYVYQQLIDMYGDIPYSQAFRGSADLTPQYENQQTIYEDLVKRLDTAMTNMAAATFPTAAEATAQDVIFALNKTRWIQFANTVKMRILMRQSFMPGRGTYIQAQMATSLSRGFIDQNVLVQPGYASVAGKQNPFYATYGYNEVGTITTNYQYRKMNKVIIDFLKNSGGSADTFRLQNLAYPIGTDFKGVTGSSGLPTTSITGGTTTVAAYIGIPLGAGSSFPTTSASPIGPFQIAYPNNTRAGMMMLLSELKFMQAEYTERYGVTFAGKSAQTLFEEGIRDHFRTIAAPSTAGNASNAGDAYAQRYYTRTGGSNAGFVNYTSATNKIQTILLQKWVSLTHISGLEQWSDYRKANTTSLPNPSSTAGVPSSVRTTATTTNPEPVRYLYPQREFDVNGANVPAVDRFTSKIFWDVN